MELRHLRYFVAVGEALNFTKAAMRLHLAQPALSRQVSDLEDELGVSLLKRTHMRKRANLAAQIALLSGSCRKIARCLYVSSALSCKQYDYLNSHLDLLRRR